MNPPVGVAFVIRSFPGNFRVRCRATQVPLRDAHPIVLLNCGSLAKVSHIKQTWKQELSHPQSRRANGQGCRTQIPRQVCPSSASSWAEDAKTQNQSRWPFLLSLIHVQEYLPQSSILFEAQDALAAELCNCAGIPAYLGKQAGIEDLCVCSAEQEPSFQVPATLDLSDVCKCLSYLKYIVFLQTLIFSCAFCSSSICLLTNELFTPASLTLLIDHPPAHHLQLESCLKFFISISETQLPSFTRT